MRTLEFQNFPVLNYEVTEGLNTLCTNLAFSGADIKKIMVTSSHENEGKTFLALNVLAIMSSFGYRVALVDADLRNSNVLGRYNVNVISSDTTGQSSASFRATRSGIRGLTHFLAGTADIEQILSKTNLGNGFMIPVGRLVMNPLPLLNSKRFNYLMEALSESMDYVFVDAPPLGPVVDALQIAKSCDASLVVVRHNDVRRQELIDVKDLIENTGCPILGCVINQLNYNDPLARRYGTSYSHYYSSKYGHKYGGYGSKYGYGGKYGYGYGYGHKQTTDKKQ